MRASTRYDLKNKIKRKQGALTAVLLYSSSTKEVPPVPLQHGTPTCIDHFMASLDDERAA